MLGYYETHDDSDDEKSYLDLSSYTFPDDPDNEKK